jgi:transposase
MAEWREQGYPVNMRETTDVQHGQPEAEKRTPEQQIREQEEIIGRQADKINHQEEVMRAQAKQIYEQQEEIGQCVQQIEDLGGQLEELCEQVEKLQEKTKKNSSNSSLPPSSDRFARQKRSRSLRKKSGKKPGGQKGHEGKTLPLVANPDLVVLHEVEICEYCHSNLQELASIRDERRQVISLPIKRRVVIEHQTQSKCCPRCQSITVAPFPADVKAPIQYGADIGAVAVYLNCQQLQPIGRTAHILADLFDCPMSPASVQAMIGRCAKALCGIEEQIKQALITSSVTHHDETSCYLAGARWWWHSSSTKELTHYAVHVKRGREAMDAIGIVPALSGTSIHDGWTSYWGYSNCQHGLCNVHHLRELKFFAEDKQQQWAADLIGVLLDMKQAVEQAKAQGASSLEPSKRAELLDRYQAAIALGYTANPASPPPALVKRGRRGQSKARNLLDRLSKRQYAVLRFLDDFAIPFDNNLAERDIRMVKVKQKISGCFRSLGGAEGFARIRGYLSTLCKQGMKLLLSLEQALAGHPLAPVSLSQSAHSP